MSTENETNPEPIGEATYCPEDNKLRLYIGRVPRPEYDALRKEGWQALHKQRENGGGDFAAVWTPERRDTALRYSGGYIGDEDQGPAERAADRAERFSGYRDKRTDEATGSADRYDAGPTVHGFQSQQRADRAAARHDRIADRAGDAWGKAEYWQRRTAGVISHALYRSAPGVRFGRIKTIEAELRKVEKQRAELVERWRMWEKIAKIEDAAKQTETAWTFSGFQGYSSAEYTHPRTGKKGSLYDFLRADAVDRLTGAEAAAMYLGCRTSPDSEMWNQTRLADWVNHYNLRLAYEGQMIEAAGGRAAFVEMIPGGFMGSSQIRKVTKSPATGRVVSVEVMGTSRAYGREGVPVPVLVNVERMRADSYRAPTVEELEAFKAAMKAEKAARPKDAPCPLINPTDEDAQKLQDAINAHALSVFRRRHGESQFHTFKPAEIIRTTQAIYSAKSKGSYARAGTRGIGPGGELHDEESNMWSKHRQDKAARLGPPLCTVRITGYDPESVIILTDKPQKPFPETVFAKPFELVAE
jgi:hypothetical protein